MSCVSVCASIVTTETVHPRWTWRWNPSADEKSNRISLRVVPVPSDHDANRLVPRIGHKLPGFLGPGRDARIDGPDLVENWQSHPPQLLWRHPVGLGWSSFAVAGNAAVTLEQRDEEECIVCYDLGRGHEVWCQREPVRFKNEHGDGPRNNAYDPWRSRLHPGRDGCRLCLELTTGELIWKTRCVREFKSGKSFLRDERITTVYDNLVVVTPGTNSVGYRLFDRYR